MPATILNQQHLSLLRNFLLQDVTGNLFGLGTLEQGELVTTPHAEWWGMFDPSDQLLAACYAGDRHIDGHFGLLVPAGEPDACRTLGLGIAVRGGGGWAVGERLATDAFWDGMGSPQHLIRSDQVLYEITEPTPGDELALRPATDEDRDWVTHAAAEMIKEDFGVDRLAVDPELFRRRIHTSIRARREIIGEVGDQPVFRVNVGTMCRYGAQLGGTWIEPRFRGQGIGKAAIRSTVAHLLKDLPRVTLHVRDNNDAAIGCYSAVGFRPSQAFRLLSR